MPLLVWLYLLVDRRSLAGIRVAGETLPATCDPAHCLASRARAWGEQKVSITTGNYRTTETRTALGASLPVDEMAQRVRSIGRSGNPLVDLWSFWRSFGAGFDLGWQPRVDRARVGLYVRAIRNRVERPPVAGTTDQSGISIAGVPGWTLDTVFASELLERTLRRGKLRMSMGLREVAAPQAIAIGSPDGIDARAHDATDPRPPKGPASVPEQYRPMLEALRPKSWLPEQGCEAMDPPYERFCQGPRKVPAPFGEAERLADRLSLGMLQTVGYLLGNGPRAEWVAAAGGPRARRSDMVWPVPVGTLWRRFGYTRRPPFRHLLHRGIDVGAPRGTPIYAANPGIVAYSDNRVRGYGNLLVVIHDDATVTFSAHCQAIYVFAGQRVRRGQIVGEVGETGLARGAHVHWEYHVEGRASDPDGMFDRD